MSDNIDTRVSLALHPDNVKEIEGYDDETIAVLAPTVTAFSEAYERIRTVWDGRAKAEKNPSWNENQVIIETDQFAQKQLAVIAKGFDSTRANLVKGIAHLEQELTAPVTSKAAHSVAAEVRAYVKALPTGERMKFIQDALGGGDDVTATAVLGAPAYLSGIDANTQSVFTRMYHERNAPAVSKRLKVMVAAKDMIEQRAGIVFKELEKAVGCPPHKAKALREARTASEKAFALRDIA
jgi:hypothetical protein